MWNDSTTNDKDSIIGKSTKEYCCFFMLRNNRLVMSLRESSNDLWYYGRFIIVCDHSVCI